MVMVVVGGGRGGDVSCGAVRRGMWRVVGCGGVCWCVGLWREGQ